MVRSVSAAKNPLQGKDAAVRRADCDFIRKDYAIAIQKYEAATERFNYWTICIRSTGPESRTASSGTGTKRFRPFLSGTCGSVRRLLCRGLVRMGRAYVAVDRNDEAMDCFETQRFDPGQVHDRPLADRVGNDFPQPV